MLYSLPINPSISSGHARAHNNLERNGLLCHHISIKVLILLCLTAVNNRFEDAPPQAPSAKPPRLVSSVCVNLKDRGVCRVTGWRSVVRQSWVTVTSACRPAMLIYRPHGFVTFFLAHPWHGSQANLSPRYQLGEGEKEKEVENNFGQLYSYSLDLEAMWSGKAVSAVVYFREREFWLYFFQT